MWTTVVLAVCLILAAWTDIRQGLIHNWVTYPGILLSFVAQYLEAGGEGVADGLRGFGVCGGVALCIYLFGGTGGGDVKLIALLGAGSGFQQGIEALLWTFALGAVMALSMIVWQVGAVRIVEQVWRQLSWIVRLRGWLPLSPEERQPLQRTLFLAPAALVALAIVRGPWVWRSFAG